MLRIPLLLFLYLGIASCRHAELLSQEPDAASQAAGRAFLAKQKTRQPICSGDLQIAGTDTWPSRFLRWFTPLSHTDSEFTLSIKRDQIELEIMGSYHWRMQQSLLYKTIDMHEELDSSKLNRIYLESLRLYILLPQLLILGENPAFLGQKSLGARSFDALFFNLQPGTWNNPELDQYIAYFEVESGRLALIQFTYRDLTRSYVGWLRFGLDDSIHSFHYPKSISILDDWDATEATHTINLRSVSCIASAAD